MEIGILVALVFGGFSAALLWGQLTNGGDA